ncbi:MAG: peptidase MA family metallohydrolase [Myxococcota bacterium]
MRRDRPRTLSTGRFVEESWGTLSHVAEPHELVCSGGPSAIRFSVRRAFQALLLAFCASYAGGAWAQPADQIVEMGPDLPAPGAPYVTRVQGPVTWVFPQGAEAMIEDLEDERADAWPALEADFGVQVDEQIEVRLVRNPEEMRELAPTGAPPPGNATGVAYTARGLIMLSMVAPESWDVPDIGTVFVHELSHIALHRAVNGHRLPRWFVEGVAINHAGEHGFERLKTLWNGERSDTLFPLETLSDAFPSRSHEVNLAYAQAADVVRFLREDRDGRRFRELIEELAEGDGFVASLDDAYARTPGVLEADWRADLNERVSSIPLIVGGSTIWAFAGLLLIAGYRRRRKLHRLKLAQMAERERQDARAIQRIESMADDEPWVVVVARDADVPTVKHDGQEHTLH